MLNVKKDIFLLMEKGLRKARNTLRSTLKARKPKNPLKGALKAKSLSLSMAKKNKKK